MGMALHPTLYIEWLKASRPWVCLDNVYHFDGCLRTKNNKSDSVSIFKTKIVRYKYNRTNKKLEDEQVIIQSLNGSSNHNSGWLAIGEVEGPSYLFYTIGDMGTGQFKNAKRKNKSQERDSLEGKILRFNLEAIGNPNESCGIPADNSFFEANSKRTVIWS